MPRYIVTIKRVRWYGNQHGTWMEITYTKGHSRKLLKLKVKH